MNFIFLALNNLNTIFFLKKKNYMILIVFILIIYINFWINFFNNVFIKNIFFSLCWFFVFYWLCSIFVFLFKKSQYNYFTGVIQKFWKTSLYVFWLLELFLFIIYLFLTMISPQEVLFMMDEMYLFLNYTNFLKEFFFNIFKLLIIILLFNIVILKLKYNSFYYLYNCIIFLLLIVILKDDFVQFYTIHQSYNFYEWKFMTDTSSWELEVEDLKFRTIDHYFYILVFLKFWHTIFIVIFFLFFDNNAFFVKTYSFNIVSSNLQNMYFLFGFGFILKITLVKFYLNYISSYVYYWFSTNFHFNNFSYFISFFNFNYLIYIYSDVINFFN